MTKEEKQLLLKDLCARLPYEVQCEIGGLRHGPYTFTGNDVEDLIAGRMFKPYLRPMSSMTEEEAKKVCRLETFENRIISVLPNNHTHYFTVGDAVIDWLNAHHFDYRGLIPMGLALEAPKDMYTINN